MAKALKTIGAIAGVVALVPSPIQPFAQAIAVAATVGAAVLAKPPPARGSVSQIIIAPDAPTPYVMGEGYFGGVLRHDTAYGATLKKVVNPYRFMATVYSTGGPVDSISPRVDFLPPGAWYSGFLFADVQTGATPESNALAPQWAGAPGWPASAKLSGQAAIGWSFLFDREGKRFASGVPLLGAEGRWVKCYDPRLDSTQPGGAGAHRAGVEATYAWTANPALHAGTYALGRFQNGKRVFGMGLPAAAIDWLDVMAWANVCDANSWRMFGVVFEPGDRWANLKDICLAGGAVPVPGAKLAFSYSAPKVVLDTITEADLIDVPASVTAMQSFRDRINTVTPKYRSPLHNWEMIDADPVVNATFLAEDGEEKRQAWPFNFVRDANQAAQLAAYKIFDSRELSAITLPCHPRVRNYRPGDCLQLDIPKLALDTPAVIVGRTINPATLEVTLELIGETVAKHAWALGQTAVPPPSPALSQDAALRDDVGSILTTYPDGTPISDLQPAEAGSDVTKAIQGVAVVDVQYTFDGTVKAAQFPLGKTYKLVTSTGVEVTSGVTWAVSTTLGGWSGAAPTITGAGSGQLSISSGPNSASAQLRLTATFAGRQYASTIEVRQKLDDPPIPVSGGSTTATGPVSGTITSSGAWVNVTGELQASTGPGITNFDLTLANASLTPLNVQTAPIGSANFQLQALWWDGATWQTVGAVADSNPDPEVIDEGGFSSSTNGSVTCNRQKTGLTGSTTYKFKWQGRYTSGAAFSASISGTASIEGGT